MLVWTGVVTPFDRGGRGMIFNILFGFVFNGMTEARRVLSKSRNYSILSKFYSHWKKSQLCPFLFERHKKMLTGVLLFEFEVMSYVLEFERPEF